MAFKITGNIKFKGFAPIKPSSLKWNKHVDNIIDTATIVLPGMCKLKQNNAETYSIVPTTEAIKIGTAVSFEVGYNGNNKEVFNGFVAKINYKVPVEIECEGWAYLLKKKFFSNLVFGKTTVAEVLKKITEGTGIVLSDKNPESIEFLPAQFKHYTAMQILGWLKENYLLTIFFEGNVLYAGWRATYVGNTVKHRLNWNVADASSLVFGTYEGSIVNIVAETRLPNGTKHKTKSNNAPKLGDTKVIKTLIQNFLNKQAAANDAQIKENNKGFTGSITGFLQPFVQVGDTNVIVDKKYPQRNGQYFVSGIGGSVNKSGGGRQQIELSYKLSNG